MGPILVTGATGQIGANLVRRLVALGCKDVAVLVRPSSNRVRLEGAAQALRFIEADLTEPQAVARALEGMRFATVFHLASSYFNPPTLSTEAHYRINVFGTLALLEWLKTHPGTRLVYAGSAAACGSAPMMREDAALNPATIYGAAKAAASILIQTYARVHNVGAVELRLFTPYGPWERASRLIPDTIAAARAGRALSLSSGRQRRDFVFMDDVVEAFVLAAGAPLQPGTVLNICSGKPLSILEVVNTVLELMGSKIEVQAGARSPRPDEIWEMSGDNARAARELGWKPTTDFRAGIRKCIDWYTTHADLAPQLP
jgi:nucleoside-diphosphate-sugar epimerase